MAIRVDTASSFPAAVSLQQTAGAQRHHTQHTESSAVLWRLHCWPGVDEEPP